ncbi:NADH-quinone oxidoreductase subunit H [Candidatus Saganbacteria bacterium]|nr:NADH-quinone oxidoreductase subunit H [Candidatus Saganbacteria bacterium]
MEYLFLILKVIIFIGLAPLLSGIITRIKNNLRFRKGPGIWQPYFNLFKLFRKDEVVSEQASWIFRSAPYIVFAATLTALMLVPALTAWPLPIFTGDFLTIIFLLSLGRFFLALAGLDPAATFGGMGSSREMFIASFVEPVVILAIFAVSLTAETTNLAIIAAFKAMHPATVLAAGALLLVTLAETSRIPIDNQETHLELTMIHEALILEYSGRSLGLLELAAYMKQILFFSLISLIVFPGWNDLASFLLKWLALGVIVAVVEISLAKMRLFRAVDWLSFAGILAIMAIMTLILGV